MEQYMPPAVLLLAPGRLVTAAALPYSCVAPACKEGGELLLLLCFPMYSAVSTQSTWGAGEKNMEEERNRGAGAAHLLPCKLEPHMNKAEQPPSQAGPAPAAEPQVAYTAPYSGQPI
eukprot:TRINITY_DN719_c0_g1_i1.p1 TRINITY_DN719_c0_g1~~TRINITY_DN719_c0_g1_i1.p1  ORF type:complete len:117 (+),score=17.40 TRINITY_DN719_c0_g1_i1:738-1088(+)